jgi:hypothetical protein
MMEKIQIGTTNGKSAVLIVGSTRANATRITSQKSAPEFGGKLTSAGLSNFINVAKTNACSDQYGPLSAHRQSTARVKAIVKGDTHIATNPVTTSTKTSQCRGGKLVQLAGGGFDEADDEAVFLEVMDPLVAQLIAALEDDAVCDV